MHVDRRTKQIIKHSETNLNLDALNFLFRGVNATANFRFGNVHELGDFAAKQPRAKIADEMCMHDWKSKSRRYLPQESEEN